MLLDFTWKAFEKTGSINSYMLFKELNLQEKKLADKDSEREEVAISTGKEL